MIDVTENAVAVVIVGTTKVISDYKTLAGRS
ncbi:MAG: hypothetical protein K0S71_2333 [Clostridia bacterium]|jgi:hypothetical protein|nr:hypothetical protein [Clostridia bacterium]